MECGAMELSDLFEEDTNRMWELLGDKIPALRSDVGNSEISLLSFRSHIKLCEQLATAHLQDCRAQNRFDFFDSTKLESIASEERVGVSALEGKMNFTTSPCVYLFASLGVGEIIKVGETDNPQTRIARDHLRSGATETEVRWHYYSCGEWPDAITSGELALLVLRPGVDDKQMRQMIETGLKSLLHPELE